MEETKVIRLTWNSFYSYINKNKSELSKVNGDCSNCPLKKQCQKAHHTERIQSIISTPPESTGHPGIIKILQRFSFVLYLIPKFIFRKWKEYDNNTLGCPSVNIIDNLSHFKELYDMLTEKKSKRTLIAVLMYRLSFNNQYLNTVYSSPPEYFDIFNKLGNDETVIDCGGYIGDTLEEYLKYNSVPAKYIIYEPDKSNIENLEKNIASMNANSFTEVYFKGVGEKDDILYLKDERGMASTLSDKKSDDSYEVEVTSIDNNNKKDGKITFIKMDIEGAEKSAIKGAKKTITDYSPKLAICLYHKPTDLWELPLLIKKINPDYTTFLIRHYHKYSFTETILYVY